MSNFLNQEVIINTEKIKTINIKTDSPPADIAVFDLSKEIGYAKKSGIEVLKVIHGYGSHGKGGEIKKKVKKYLFLAQKRKEIEFFVCGDEWGELNENVKILKENYPEFILDHDIRGIN
ncbi:MAG: Smr/MutS family protein, partial [Clostridia bacterium]|nr:Smr/MutS family protein [Clostridia bacterium]